MTSDKAQLGSPFQGDSTYATFTRLVRVQTKLWNDADAVLRERHGVQLTDVTPLELVAAVPGCRVQDIVDTLHITVGGASKTVDRLVAGGYVVRSAHPDDRRSSVLSPTHSGRSLLSRVKPELDDILGRRLTQVLTRAELTGLDRALTALQRASIDHQEEA